MAMGRRQAAAQGEFWIPTDTLRKAPGHPFYQRLNRVLHDEHVQTDRSSLHVKQVVTDKGYHSGQTLVNLEEVDIRGYVSGPDRGRRRRGESSSPF